MVGLLGFDPKKSNWLRQTLNDLRGPSGEVEEVLKKPIAHIVDLMNKSISIRNAGQSLGLNYSL